MDAIESEILNLERELLEPDTQPSRWHELLADDFLEVGSSGRVYDKAATIAALSAAENIGHTVLTPFHARRLADDLVLATYRAVRTRTGAAPAISWRSSLWRRERGAWRIVFHQGTPCPADDS